jgi:hypothetical protein
MKMYEKSKSLDKNSQMHAGKSNPTIKHYQSRYSLEGKSTDFTTIAQQLVRHLQNLVDVDIEVRRHHGEQ